MKKKLSIVTSAALLLALGFTMAGCGKGVAKISPEIEGEYSASLTQNVLQANTANTSYDFGDDDGAGHVVVTETVTNALLGTDTVTYYKVFDLETNQFTNITSTTELDVLDEGVFYTENVTIDMSSGVAVPVPNGTYTLFSTEGYSTPSAVKGEVSDNVFYAEDGSRWYVDVDGELVQESDPFEMILVNANTEKYGKYYINRTSEDTIHIFDKKGKYQRSFNYEYSFGMTEDMEVVSTWIAGYNLFMQIATALPEYEDKYDVIITNEYTGEAEKYNLDTYYYSIKNGKVKEVKNFDYWVEGYAVYSYSEDIVDYAVLDVREIKNKRVSETTLVQSFGEKGKVYYDIQKLVPGATAIEYTEAGYTLLADYAGFTYIYEKDDCVLKIPEGSANVDFASGDIVYYTVGTNLYVYDLDEKAVVYSVGNVSQASTNNNGNIVYATYDEIASTTTWNIYNVESLSVSYSYTMDATKQRVSGSFSGSYVCIAITSLDMNNDTVTTYTVMFPDSSIAEIAGVASASIVDSYYVDGVEYTIFSTTMITKSVSNDGLNTVIESTIVSYHVGVEVYPTVK